MAREIKFRVWVLDTDENQTPIEMVYCQDFKECSGIDENYGNLSKWMQYTGLKDKNGKEIYEGDIVKSKVGNVHQIHWDDYRWGCDSSALNYMVDFGIEIIGNIYEHPELLK